MKIVKPSRIYSICFWVSMPLITFALMYILYDERIWTDWRVWIVSLADYIFHWIFFLFCTCAVRCRYPEKISIASANRKTDSWDLAVNLLS